MNDAGGRTAVAPLWRKYQTKQPGLAITNHNRYLHGELGPGIRTKSPEAVTGWFADKVPFQFRLPSSEAALQANPTYELAGASLVQYRGIPAAMVVYLAPSGTISFLVESSKAAVVAGGDESRYGALMFHYRNEGRFKVITWSLQPVLLSCFVDRKFGTGILHGLPSKHGRSRAVPQAAVALLSPKLRAPE